MKKYLFNLKTLSIFLSGLIVCGVVHAQLSARTNSTTQTSTVQNTQLTEATRQAQQWNIQPEEWQRYQKLMEGPLGIYSPGLDPLTALGISARNDSERRRYAELQVIAETQRVERELAYQRAYDDAFKRMYPKLLPVNFGSSSQSAVAIPTGSGRLAVFIKDNCKPCDAEVQQLQKAGAAFDIYMVDSNNDDAAIRKWATQASIDPQKVLARTITLNHDSGRWQTMGISGDLPAVVREVGGKWQRQ